MSADLLCGAVVGGLWTLIVGSVVVGALRDELGPVHIERVPVHPDTYQPWADDEWMLGIVAALTRRLADPRT